MLGDVGGFFYALRMIFLVLATVLNNSNFNWAVIQDTFKSVEKHEKRGFDRLEVAKNEI